MLLGKEVSFVFACASLLRTCHHDWAVSVTDDRVRDAPHQRPSQRSAAAAPHDYHSGAQPLSEPHDLRVRTAQPRMGFRDLAPRLAYLLHQLLKFGSGRL